MSGDCADPAYDPGQARGYVSGALRWVGTLGIATVAVMRCLILFAPQVVFDVDPALDPTPLPGLGPAGSLWLDAALLLFAACGLAGEAISRRGIDWRILLLAFIPLPLVLWHGFNDGGDLWRGTTWAAAAIACVAVAHLARDRALRTVLFMLLAAVIFPLLVRGAANITFEHDDTLKQWENNKAAFLAEKGWEADSPNTLIYERRMSHREPRGWFTSTNVFGSLAAFSTILLLGLAIVSARAKLTSGWVGLMALLVIASAAALWMTGSMGALLAALGGLVLLLLVWLHTYSRYLSMQFGSEVALLCVLGVTVAVGVRGAMLPEGFAGERSLLYRWHYVVSSTLIVAENPLTGVGPDSYQPAYTKHRLPRNPEEVASAHSMFFDWLCTLGLAGAAWIALVLVQIWRVGKKLKVEPEWTGAVTSLGPRAALVAVGAVCALGIVPAIIVERHELQMDVLSLLLRGIGLVGYAVLALAIMYVLNRVHDWVLDVALAAATLALLVHGQIEMTFTQSGSVVWAMCVLGLAGPARAAGANRVGWIGAALAGGVLLWITFTGAIPASRQQAMMIEAAEMLRPIAEKKIVPDSPEAEALREQAARRLEVAHDLWPADLSAMFAAGDQMERASWFRSGQEKIPLLNGALDRLQICIDRAQSAKAMNLAFFIRLKLSEVTGDEAHHEAALELAKTMTELDPNGITSWRRLGDLLWRLDRAENAAAAYERALLNNGNFALDPLKQLPEKDRLEIERRVDEARSR